MSERKIAKAGRLLLVDQGEYSDYSVLGFFVVLKDFDPISELKDHLKNHKEQKAPYSFEGDSYLSSLISRGLILEIEYNTLYLGAYSSCENLSFTTSF